MTATAVLTARPDLLPMGAIVSRPSAQVRVAAPARLHLGFLDPAATLGRRFGSVGKAW